MGTSDSKLAFHEARRARDTTPKRVNIFVWLQGIIALSESDASGWSDAQWALLWNSGIDLVDVFQLVSPDQVRNIRSSKPANLALFLKKA
jgi:hypothetical protein